MVFKSNFRLKNNVFDWTLLEEIRPVSIQKIEIKNRQISKKTFDLWECPAFDGKNQVTENSTDAFFPFIKLLIVTIMKKIKPVVTDKHHFHNRE